MQLIQNILQKLKRLFNQQGGKILYAGLGAIIVFNIFYPATVGFADESKKLSANKKYLLESPARQYLPEVGNRMARQLKTIRVTGYSSSVQECDSSPFITASGTRVHEGTLAANCLPFGTKVRIPELFGDKIFTVEDRLNRRFGCSTIDVWQPDRGSALKIGSQYTTIEIL